MEIGLAAWTTEHWPVIIGWFSTVAGFLVSAYTLYKVVRIRTVLKKARIIDNYYKKYGAILTNLGDDNAFKPSDIYSRVATHNKAAFRYLSFVSRLKYHFWYWRLKKPQNEYLGLKLFVEEIAEQFRKEVV